MISVGGQGTLVACSQDGRAPGFPSGVGAVLRPLGPHRRSARARRSSPGRSRAATSSGARRCSRSASWEWAARRSSRSASAAPAAARPSARCSRSCAAGTPPRARRHSASPATRPRACARARPSWRGSSSSPSRAPTARPAGCCSSSAGAPRRCTAWSMATRGGRSFSIAFSGTRGCSMRSSCRGPPGSRVPACTITCSHSCSRTADATASSPPCAGCPTRWTRSSPPGPGSRRIRASGRRCSTRSGTTSSRRRRERSCSTRSTAASCAGARPRASRAPETGRRRRCSVRRWRSCKESTRATCCGRSASRRTGPTIARPGCSTSSVRTPRPRCAGSRAQRSSAAGTRTPGPTSASCSQRARRRTTSTSRPLSGRCGRTLAHRAAPTSSAGRCAPATSGHASASRSRRSSRSTVAVGARTSCSRKRGDSRSPGRSARSSRALGARGRPEDLVFLHEAFPSEESAAFNRAAAHELLRRQDPAALPVLRAAIWRGPWDRSVLACALLLEQGDFPALRDELERAPATATEADLRRVGFALGRWGGMAEVDALARGRRAAGTDPVLQGAVLGALAARTY